MGTTELVVLAQVRNRWRMLVNSGNRLSNFLKRGEFLDLLRTC
jgi:hypothetical protein